MSLLAGNVLDVPEGGRRQEKGNRVWDRGGASEAPRGRDWS